MIIHLTIEQIHNMERTKSTLRKAWTIIDNYFLYPYKCIDNTKSQGRNHVSQKHQICNHKYSLSLEMYKKIIYECLLYQKQRLLEGKRLILPYDLGFIEVRKRFRNLESNTKKEILPSLKWKKVKRGVRFQSFYYVKFLNTFKAECAKHFNSDLTNYNNI